MVLQENKQLRDYELVVIINPEVADEGIETLVSRISKYVTDNGGTVASVDKWGKKRLAYPLKRFKEGFYFLARFKIQPNFIKELEASLRISEEVLRHLVTNVES